MVVWQADLYRRPLQGDNGEPLWELLVCDRNFDFSYGSTHPQSQISSGWVQTQLKQATDKAGYSPATIQVFRPQSLTLISTAGQALGLKVVPYRHTLTLKQWLQQRAKWYPTLANYTGADYNPLAVDRPPPTPLPETLWGEQWRFAALGAGEFERTLPHEPIPICHLPPELMPRQVGLSSSTPLPGLVIDAGRQAMALALWLQTNQPAWLTYISGDPDGLILEAGLVDRWILTTFSDPEVAVAGRQFEQRKAQSQGLHWLLVRPDDSGLTYTGLWLLQQQV